VADFQRTIMNPEGVAPPSGRYSHAILVRAGRLLFIAGQTGRDAEGKLVGHGDVATQTRQVFHNIGKILQDAGATFSNVVQFTTYLVADESVRPFLETRSEVFDELYPDRDYPPNTLLNVQSLGGGDALVEISAIAALP
jgi:enamine deaminase RidA (YjgF/YER057c/UK114 family)